MSRLDQLPEITDHVLSGLRADDALKHRIYQEAAQDGTPREKASRRPLIALCTLSAAMIAVFVLLGRIGPLSRKQEPEEGAPMSAAQQMETITAGERRNVSPIGLGSILETEEENASAEEADGESSEEADEVTAEEESR